MRRHDESYDAGWQLSGEQEGGRPRGARRGGAAVGYPDQGVHPDYERSPRPGPNDRRPPRQGRPARGGGPPPKPPVKKKRSRGHTVSAVIAGIVVLVLVSGALALYGKYRAVYDSIGRVDVSGDLKGVKQPKSDPNAVNILMIGSDSRSGANGKIGGTVGIGGQRSDTVMLLHVAPGGKRAVVLSFPRDSVVPILSCTAEAGAPGQTDSPGSVEQINATFANGGPGCLWKTVMQATGISVNHFVELNFVGFEKVINDLGGVNVCLPAAVNDPKSNLDLTAGLHHIYGPEALAFWRTREDVGEGSDLQRIQRDQFLMASLVQGIEHSGLLNSPSKMNAVIGDAAASMTTDSGLDQSAMLKVAEDVHGLNPASVQFIQVPTVTYTGNANWVQFSPSAPQLFSAIASDSKLPAPAKKGAPATPPPATVSPSQVNVEVLNGSGANLIAAEGASQLSERGFNVLGSHNADNFSYGKSVVEYGSSADRAAAQTLYNQFTPNVEIEQNAAVPAGEVEVILGSTFSELTTAQPTSQGSLTKTYGGITGHTNPCSDGAAFAGPDGE